VRLVVTEKSFDLRVSSSVFEKLGLVPYSVDKKKSCEIQNLFSSILGKGSNDCFQNTIRMGEWRYLPGRDTKVDLSVKGKEYPPVKFKVEKAHIAAFAQAIDDSNKLYTDEKYAAKTKYKGIIAPPTYPACFAGPLEMGKQPPPLLVKIGLDAKLNPGLMVHGEQEFEYFAPVRPGDEIIATARIADVERKPRKDGSMRGLIVIEVTSKNQKGEKVVVARNLAIER
jgi:acyl dehydratase